MAKLFEEIDDTLAAFIRDQKVFFIATAPLAAEGHVNLSPKGLDTLRILDPHTVAYLDLTGSGVETISHLKENGRFVMMFCAFEGRPKILRLHGRGAVLERGDAEFDELLPLFPSMPGARAIIKLSVERVADSCGWGVPKLEFKGERDQLPRYASQIGDEGLRDGQLEANMAGIDGLPGLRAPSV
ncbi:MAG: pyridoxamine 5'-phosphate oxidase family protein [Gammaproteobacteria bacterium]|jgi:hypothetical protein